ncbi:MAG: energy transducer TonB [Bacteroidota bacterium]
MTKWIWTLGLLLSTLQLIAQEVILFDEAACPQIAEQTDQAPQLLSSRCEYCTAEDLRIVLRKGFEMKKSKAKVTIPVKVKLRLLVDDEGALAGVLFTDTYAAKIKEEVLERLKKEDVSRFRPAQADDAAVCSWTDAIELSYGKYGFRSEIFQVVQSMPRFPGCEHNGSQEERDKCAREKTRAFLYDRLVYPEEAREKKIEGVVVVRLIIDEEGNAVYPTVLSDIGGGCGAAALAALADMPRWVPGAQGGRTVNVYYMIPVRFEL